MPRHSAWLGKDAWAAWKRRLNKYVTRQQGKAREERREEKEGEGMERGRQGKGIKRDGKGRERTG